MQCGQQSGMTMNGLHLKVGRAVMTALALMAVAVAPVVAAPANDRKRDATPIPSLSFNVTQSTEGATARGDRQPSCAPAGQIVWFVMNNAPANFQVQASGYDTVLAVYESGGGDKEFACDNNGGDAGGSKLTISGHAGKTLYFAVGLCCDKDATTTARLAFSVM